MAKKNNLKSVRLSDQVMDYVINFEGDGFNQKFENLVLFCMEQEIGDVRRALTHLERQTNDLSDLMDKLLKDKDDDPELPFP